jgi:hypothetical protein
VKYDSNIFQDNTPPSSSIVSLRKIISQKKKPLKRFAPLSMLCVIAIAWALFTVTSR